VGADILCPFTQARPRARATVSFCQTAADAPGRVAVANVVEDRQSHFEVRCSEEIRRRGPDAPRSTTLSV
jgi:hypothetical protein